MLIEKICETKSFDDVLLGRTFIYQHKLFIKTVPIYENCEGIANAVDLQNGFYEWFDLETEVCPVDTKVVFAQEEIK